MYEVPGKKKARVFRLDARIDLEHVGEHRRVGAVRNWMQEAASALLLPEGTAASLKGLVFEVRQGYKSKDAKRQDADIANAAGAYAHDYMPVMLVLSRQIDDDVAARYTESLWVLLLGGLNGPVGESTYVFCRDVLGYDVAAFFERNSAKFKGEVENVLRVLLSP